MSEVRLVQMSENPVGLMYLAARNCYSAGGPFELIEQAGFVTTYHSSEGTSAKSKEDMWKLVGNVLESGHESVAEHVYFTFAVEGIPRYTMAQVTRHRHCSFSIQSQRYVEIKEDPRNLKVLYDAVLEEDMGAVSCLRDILNKYFTDVDENNFLLLTGILMLYLKDIATGKKAEDARAILPNCTKTNMIMSVNLRELMHIAELRLCKRAQKDIQDMVQQMCDLVVAREPLFEKLLAKPCVKYGKCKEKKPCTKE